MQLLVLLGIEEQLQSATAVCVRRHDPSQCVSAPTVCVVCLFFVFVPRHQVIKGNAPEGKTVLAKLCRSTPLRRRESTETVCNFFGEPALME